jgi:hypothetical protein
MGDTFLFQSKKNGFQLLVFGTSLTDARNYAKNTHLNFDMTFVCKNPIVSKYVVCGTTDSQVKLNKISLQKLMGEE